MSATLADQTLTLNTLTTIPLDQFPLAYVDWIVLVNASPFALIATFGGSNFHVPAWYYYPVNVQGQAPQTPTVLPYLQTIPGVGFTKTLSTLLYMQNEQPDILLPQPLGGGPVDLTVASSVNQTGQPAGNSVIFAEPVNDTSVTGAVNLNNQGQLVLGDATYNGSIAILGIGGNRQISLSLTGYFREFDASGNMDVDIEPGSTTINGSTSGTAQLWQLWRGNFKYVFCLLNNFRNGGGSTQTIAFPVAFTTKAYCRTSDFPAAQLLKAGVAQTVNIITALAVGGGTPTGASVFGGYSFFDAPSGIDTLSFNSGQVTPHTGILVIEGI